MIEAFFASFLFYLFSEEQACETIKLDFHGKKIIFFSVKKVTILG
ncbi:hypothetical protein RV12_GL002827 [Enterococcus quebecensis]|nr:hypothetical protein RV12_GL002827 [Enterococcus quebecensis]